MVSMPKDESIIFKLRDIKSDALDAYHLGEEIYQVENHFIKVGVKAIETEIP